MQCGLAVPLSSCAHACGACDVVAIAPSVCLSVHRSSFVRLSIHVGDVCSAGPSAWCHNGQMFAIRRRVLLETSNVRLVQAVLVSAVRLSDSSRPTGPPVKGAFWIRPCAWQARVEFPRCLHRLVGHRRWACATDRVSQSPQLA